VSLLAKLLPQQRSAASEKRELSRSSFVVPSLGGLYPDTVGELQAMQSMALFACVRLLSDVIASMPWYVCRLDSNNIAKRIPTTPAVIRKPCVDMPLFDWKWMVVNTLALRGNSYHLVTGRDNTGMPTGLMPIHPDFVFLERRTNVLEWYDPIYRVVGERVPREDIIHIRRFTLAGEPYGLSPIRQAARAIGITLAAEEYGHRYFRDSANPSSILKTDQSLPPEEVEEVQAQWMASHGGRHYPAVLSGGFDWKPISISPDESQFLQTRQYQISDIARLYGVPPHLIGDQEKATSWGTGIESMNLGFHTYTLMGWTTCIENAISDFLPRGQFVRFDPSALLRGDFKTQVEAINLARQASLLSANEGRAKFDMGPIPNGDGYLQPMNYAPLGFDPSVTPMPKVVEGGTVEGEAPAAPAAAPTGQEPAPGGTGRSLSEFMCRLDGGRPQYYDAHTGETVTFLGGNDDQ
jgi:HK97 family phage portal protein